MTGETSRIRYVAAVLGLAAMALAAAGCGTSNAMLYQPVLLALDMPPGAISGGKLPTPEAVPPVHVRVLGRGGLAADVKGTTTEAFRVHFVVTNAGPNPVTVDPAKVYLIDKDGTKIATAEAWIDNRKVAGVTVEPDKDEAFTMVFPLAAATPLKDLKEVGLRWPYVYGGKAFFGGAQFVQIDPNALDMPSDYGDPNDKFSPHSGWSGTVGPVVPVYYYGGSGWGVTGYGRRWGFR